MHYSDEEQLTAARESLFQGIKLSKQGSYARRAPNPESLPDFHAAKKIAREVLAACPGNREALKIMSQVSECLLDYKAAVFFLNLAFAAGEPRSKKALKRLAVLLENEKAWQDLSLSPEMLHELGDHLIAMNVGPGNRDLSLTREWLSAHWDGDLEDVIAALEQRGAFSDFQVLSNVVYG